MASPPDIPIQLFWREAKGSRGPSRRPAVVHPRDEGTLGRGWNGQGWKGQGPEWAGAGMGRGLEWAWGLEWTGAGMDRVWQLTPLGDEGGGVKIEPEFLTCVSRWKGYILR